MTERARPDAASWGSIATIVIDRYDHLPSLRRLRAEADKVCQLFTDAGFTRIQTDLSVDGTARKVIDAFRAWQPDCRRLVVYWGGHGKALTADGGYFLCCRDTARRSEPDQHTALSAAELGRRLADLGVTEIVLLMDACGAGGGALEVANAFTAKVSRTGFQTVRPSLAVISSASYLQQATESAFSAAVSAVLRDGAPVDQSYLPWTDRDSHITPGELAQGVRVLLARNTRNIQIPDHYMAGIIGRFFPNPRFRSNVPDTDLESGQTAALGRPLLPQDVTDHFMVKFRGIDSAEDQGWYFTGRHRVLRRVVGWLARGTGLLVITGGPGCGKSALLGRLAVLSVAGYRKEVARQGGLDGLPADTLPPVGAIDAGVHAKHKSLLGCVAQLAEALAIPVPANGWQAPADLLLQIARRRTTTTVLFDALDEAQPADVHALASDLLRPLAELPKVRVLVGTRPVAATGTDTLLAALGANPHRTVWLDRDDDQLADITEYTRRRLLDIAASAYRGRPGDADLAATRIAEHSAGVFLFARLLASVFARRGEVLDLAGDEAAALLSGGISEAFAADLRRFGADEPKVRALLAPLAWAEGLGLPGRTVWLAVANALAGINQSAPAFTEADLVWLIGWAGAHVVASSEDDQTVYRLYHQSYSDYFRVEFTRAGPETGVAHAVITRALVGLVERDGVRHWRSANPYLIKHLPAHAAQGGWLPRLCDDPSFLVHVDPVRLKQVLGMVDHRRHVLARLYWRALSELVATTPEQRLEILGAVALREEPEAIPLLTVELGQPWSPLWSICRPLTFHRPLGAHRQPAFAVDIGTVGRRPTLVSGGGDHTVRLWDLTTGEPRGTFIGHRAPVLAVAMGNLWGRAMIVSGDSAGMLHVWDVATGQRIDTLRTRRGAVLSLVIIDRVDGNTLVCAGEDGSVIRVWQLADRALIAELPDHHTSIRALAVLAEPGSPAQLLSGGDDGRIGVWDTETWELSTMIDTTGYPLSIAAARVAGQLVLAIGGYWGTLSLWGLREQTFLRHLKGHSAAIGALAFGQLDGRTVLATAGDDGGVQVWDPRTGRRLKLIYSSPSIQETVLESVQSDRMLLGPAGGAVATDDEAEQSVAPYSERGSMLALRFTSRSGQPTLVTGGMDGAIRLWDIEAEADSEDPDVAATSVAVGTAADSTIVAIGHRRGTVTVRDAGTGQLRHRLLHDPYGRSVLGVLIGRISGRDYVISRGENGVMRFWDVDTGIEDASLLYSSPGKHQLHGACFLRTADGEYLAHLTGSTAIELMSARTGTRKSIQAGERPPAYLSAIPGDNGGDLLAVGFIDGNVAVLDPTGGLVTSLDQKGLCAAPLGFVAQDRWMLATTGATRCITLRSFEPGYRKESDADTILGFRRSAMINTLAYGEVLGGVLAAGTRDGSLTLSHATTGEHLRDLPSHFAAIRALAFGTVNGNSTLVSCGDEGIQAISFPATEA